MKHKNLLRVASAICMLMACLFALLSAQTALAAANEASVSITVNQTYTAPEDSVNEGRVTYKFTSLVAGNPMPQGSVNNEYTFAITGTGNVEIGPIEYNRIGLYSYEVKQSTATKENDIEYDKSVYRIDVYIIAQADGTLEESVVIRHNELKTDSINFAVSLVQQGPPPYLTVSLSIVNTVIGSPETNSLFTFKLMAQNKDNPMPEGSLRGAKTLSIYGSGMVDFGSWTYTEAGTYVYAVYGLSNGTGDYIYDGTVYTVTDVVTLENGQLVLKRTIENSAGVQREICNFVNQYTVPENSNPGSGGSSGGNTGGNNAGGNNSGGGNPDWGSSGSNNSGGSDAGKNPPQTGDEAIMQRYAVIALLIGLVILIILLINKKRDNSGSLERK